MRFIDQNQQTQMPYVRTLIQKQKRKKKKKRKKTFETCRNLRRPKGKKKKKKKRNHLFGHLKKEKNRSSMRRVSSRNVKK